MTDHVKATRRLAFLKYLYDDYRNLSAGHGQKVQVSLIQEALGIETAECLQIFQYLQEKGLIRFMGMGPWAAITDDGIDRVEDTLEAPDQPTELLPATNVISVGTMKNSTIQQASPGASQALHVSEENTAQLLQLIDR